MAVDSPAVPTPISLREFFEAHPPGSSTLVDVGPSKLVSGNGVVDIPEITLHCSHERCQGPRHYAPTARWSYSIGRVENDFVRFVCRNCGSTFKIFAVQASFPKSEGLPVSMHKFGEIPAFGPPTPARMATLLGGERDYYFKGRRAESQSMGIAAFAYYRRIVENKKAEIFDQIIRVSRLLNADPALLTELEQAKSETQFTKAVDVVKYGIPQILLINGHNPLTLLHSALSEGLHAQSDKDCLELAHSIRIVLTEFVDRVATAMKEEQELAGAVSRLMQVKARSPASK